MTEFYVRSSNIGVTAECLGWIGQANFLGVTDEPGEAAIDGTRLHALMADLEIWLFGKIGTVEERAGDPPRLWNSTEERDELVEKWAAESGADLEPDDIWLLGSCLEVIKPFLHYMTDYDIEYQVEIPGLDRPGTLDLVIGTVEEDYRLDVIFDWKFKYKSLTRAHTYAQTTTYWLGWVELRSTLLGDCNLTRCIVHLPRLGQTYQHEYTSADLAEATKGLEAIVKAADSPQWWKNLSPSPSACEHCPCAAECPALKAMTKDLAPVEDRELVSVWRHADFVRWQPVIERQLAASRAVVRQALENGQDVPGFELREKKGDRYLASNVDAYRALSAHGLISADELTRISKISVPKLIETAIARVPDKTANTKKAKRSWVETLLEGIIQRGESRTELRRTE